MSTIVVETWGNNSTDTYMGLEDTYISTNGADLNHSSDNVLIVGHDYSARTLIQFSPSLQLLYSDTIQDARLRLYCTYTYTGSRNIRTYRVFKGWILNDATYNRFRYNVLWNIAGCNNASDSGVDDGVYDRKSTVEYDVGTQVVGGWLEIDLTNIVKKWINKESKEYGVVLIWGGHAISGVRSEFTSSRGTDGYRPHLQITYQNKYKFSGLALDQGSPAVDRKIIAHRRDTSEIVGYTTTSGDGSYELITTYSGEHYVVCLDDDASIVYNDKILGRMFPEVF